MARNFPFSSKISRSRCVKWVLGSLVLLFLAACTPADETGLEGRITFGDAPLAGAQVEIYLKGEKDRSTAPFAVAATDDSGAFRIDLPAGHYWLVGKKREETAEGRVRMLMADCPANPVAVNDGVTRVPGFALSEMGRGQALVPDPGTGIVGRLSAASDKLGGAFVYVYTDGDADLMGPSYSEVVRVAADGVFRIDLPAGTYHLAARWRAGGGRIGAPEPGDLNGVYPGNPVEVPRGQMVRLGDFSLAPVDGEKRVERRTAGTFAATSTALHGRIIDGEGAPVGGVYVFAYADRRMVGKPGYISAPTGDDGRFTLYLGTGGTWYIGARSAFGGPLEPGEWVGTYDGRADHGFTLAEGEKESLGDIAVREVW